MHLKLGLMKSAQQSTKASTLDNAEGAKALLAKAGFKDVNGDGFVDTPSGKSFGC